MMNWIYGLICAALLIYLGWLGNYVIAMKTNNLHHLEINLRKLMQHQGVEGEDLRKR